MISNISAQFVPSRLTSGESMVCRSDEHLAGVRLNNSCLLPVISGDHIEKPTRLPTRLPFIGVQGQMWSASLDTWELT